MASGRFRRFTKVEKLEEVGRPLLKRLFDLPEYAAAFARAGVTFPDDTVPDEDYYAGVADLFRRSEALPDKVSDDLHVMDELAGIQEMDDLRERFRAKKHDLPPAARTVMEVIVELWIVNATLVKAVHFDMVLHRLTGYEQFEPKKKPDKPFLYPGDDVLEAMRPRLSEWFQNHDRGPDVLIEHYPIGGEHWFIVKHNEPVDVVRELKNGESRTYRIHPRKDDVIVYSPETGGIRINARGVRARALYRETFALHLFGNVGHFYSGSTYTLAPLAKDVDAALKLVPGMTKVVVKELRFLRWGEPPTTETQAGEDVIASFRSRKFTLRENTPIYRATFEVTFGDDGQDDDPKPRKFKVSRGNNVQIARDCDHTIFDQFLRNNGYVQAEDKQKRTRRRTVARANDDSESSGSAE